MRAARFTTVPHMNPNESMTIFLRSADIAIA